VVNLRGVKANREQKNHLNECTILVVPILNHIETCTISTHEMEEHSQRNLEVVSRKPLRQKRHSRKHYEYQVDGSSNYVKP
jgi:hypothetical protein